MNPFYLRHYLREASFMLKQTKIQAHKRIPCLIWKREFMACPYSALVCVMSQMNSFPTLKPNLFNAHVFTLLSSAPESSKRSRSSGFPTKFLHPFITSNLSASCPKNRSLFLLLSLIIYLVYALCWLAAVSRSKTSNAFLMYSVTMDTPNHHKITEVYSRSLPHMNQKNVTSFRGWKDFLRCKIMWVIQNQQAFSHLINARTI